MMKIYDKLTFTENWSPKQKLWLRLALGIAAVACLIFSLFPKFKTHDLNVSKAKLSVEIPNKITASNKKSDKQLNIASAKNPTTDTHASLNNASSKNETTASDKSTTNSTTAETWQTVKVQPGDTLAKIFKNKGVSRKDMQALLVDPNAAMHLTSLQPGQTLKLRINPEKTIDEMTLELSRVKSVQILRIEQGFKVVEKELPLEKQLAFGKGKIDASLSSAAKKAGLDRNIIKQLTNIFSNSLNLSVDLKPEDSFRVLFEEKYLEGEKIETGDILAAEIVNRGTKHQAIRYTDTSGNTSYFSPEGSSLQQAFLRTPVNFTRISSHFGNRKHPILHKLRKHKGVDFAAPHGTPVSSIGDAKVIYAGTQGGYGKVIKLQHGSRYMTLYAHLSKFAPKIKVGGTVKQGQIIGYVGRTGLATGDHLHFEFHIDGVYHNFLTAAIPKKTPISESNKPHFLAHAKEMLRLLDAHEMKIKLAAAELLKYE